MNELKLVLKYSFRLFKREWKRFILPFLSLLITSAVICLVLLLTSSSNSLVTEKSKEILGGDVVIESTSPVDTNNLWSKLGFKPVAESFQISFNGSLKSEAENLSASFLVVDDLYPLYGQLVLETNVFSGLNENQILLDRAGASRLKVSVGDSVRFGDKNFLVSGIVAAEPNSLFGGFRFFPRVFLSQRGFESANINPSFLRAEYIYSSKFNGLSATQKELILNEAKESKFQVSIVGNSRQGIQLGLSLVSQFLVVVVLVTSVLAAVNVYASILYLLNNLKRSFAVLLALGLRKKSLFFILGCGLFYIVILASFFGTFLGNLLFKLIQTGAEKNYLIFLPNASPFIYGALSLLLIVSIAFGSFLPAVRRSLNLSPKDILVNKEELGYNLGSLKTFLPVTFFALLPLIFIASFLLENLLYGFVFILAIVLVYLLIAVLFNTFLNFIYKFRNKFSFFVKSIIAYKKADGLFGIVSFTSLFFALASLSIMVLVQVTLQSYLTQDLARTVPNSYVIDVQPSQKDELVKNFPELVLFPNIRGRILDIDGRKIQELIAKGDESVDRELGREYNLTFRSQLLNSEKSVKGEEFLGKKGEISVEQDFAKRAGINLNSSVTFFIQGFEVTAKVTNFREVDNRSGLPFFFFVLSPEDLAQFPSVNFGYAYHDQERQSELSEYLATKIPNASLIPTEAVGKVLVQIVSILTLLVLIISIPPLLIATLLIATLVVSSYASRRREGARLRALGSNKSFVLKQYLVETISLTFLSAIFAYSLGVATSYVLSKYFLKLDTVTLFDFELIVGLGLIVVLVGLIGLYLLKSDNMKLRELLSYEETR